MLISVLNIKLTCEWHKVIILNYKNTRTHVIVVLRVPSTIHDTWMPSGDVTWLTAHCGISLLHNCTKINTCFTDCSKCHPPAAMQFSARIKWDWVAEPMLFGWFRMCSAAAKIRSRSTARESTLVSYTNVFMWPQGPMREAILRVDRRGLLWTIWRMFSRVLIVCTTSLSDCKETLGREPVSRNV